MNLSVRASTLKMLLAFSSFLWLIAPLTYYASLLVGILLIPLVLKYFHSVLDIKSLGYIHLNYSLLCGCIIYFFACTILATNYYIASIELVSLLCSIGLFTLFIDLSKAEINANVIASLLIITLLSLCWYCFQTIDIFNYTLFYGDKIDSKNYIGFRRAFLVFFLASFSRKEHLSSFAVRAAVLPALFLGVMLLFFFLESTRSIMFLFIAVVTSLVVSNFSKLTKIFPWAIIIVLLAVAFHDDILRFLSSFTAFNLLFFKLEPYIPGSNQYGSFEGGYYARKSFTDSAFEIAKLGISENPLFGLGPNQSRVLFEQELGSLTNSHNTYLELWLSYGIFGLILWSVFFISLLYTTFAFKKSKYFSVVTGFFIGTLAISFISPVYREPDINVMFGFALLILTTRIKT